MDTSQQTGQAKTSNIAIIRQKKCKYKKLHENN